MKKVIITGHAGTGKSSLLDALSSRFEVCKEVSRELIIEQQQLDSDLTPWGNVAGYSEIVLDRMVSQYRQQVADLCIYDRAIPDLIAGLDFHALPIAPHYIENALTYLAGAIVFMAPTWRDIYCIDPQRPEPYETQSEMNKFLYEAYVELGFCPVLLPKESIESRAEFVMGYLKKGGWSE